MCGIFGLLSVEGMTKWQDRKSFLAQATITGTLRGMDSTGIFAVNKEKEIHSYKRALSGWDFVEMPKVKKIVSDADKFPFIIGHNRAATKGAVNNANSHPFHCGHIIGVHNGSLWSHRNLKGCSKFDVDSEAVFYSMANNGEEETIAELDGSFALVWYNQQENVLKMVRNDDRPLHFATIKGQKTVLIASEKDMLHWLGPRNNLEIEQMYQVVAGNIISFNMETLEWTAKKVKLKEKVTYPNFNRNSVVLSDLGYKFNEEVDFKILSYATYSAGSQYGVLDGITTNHPYDKVRIHSVEKSFINRLGETKDVILRSKVVGAFMKDVVFLNLKVDDLKKVEVKKIIHTCVNCGDAVTDVKADNKCNEGRDVICDTCLIEQSLGAC